MEKKEKKRVFLKHKKSSALVVSIIIHAVFFLVAITFVAVSVVKKNEIDFEAKEVKRPKMNLRKLQVPVKQNKTQAPKLRQNIIAKPRTPNVEIKMPAIVGIQGGTGYGQGGGLGGLGFGFEIPDLFGGNKRGAGNEFLGHFYDLKQTSDGRLSEIGELLAKANGDWDNPNYSESRKKYQAAVRSFLGNWEDRRLDHYFMAPREKFATTFMIPILDAEEAPKAYGVEDQVKPMEWVALYRGQICAPETGKYRFVGRGDDVLVVRVKKRLVIDASWIQMAEWESGHPNNGKYASYNKDKGCIIGEWFHLQKGRPVPMEVLIGEEPGGHFFCQLYIEKEGGYYPTTTETYVNSRSGQTETLNRPILPIFKTADVSDKLTDQMKVNPAWATIDGPSFGSVK